MRTHRLWPLLLLPVGGCEEAGDGPEPSTTGAEAACGDGLVQDGEACDLGFANRDGGPCRSDCTVPVCGDERLDLDEDCDDGADGSPGCTSSCADRLREERRLLLPNLQPGRLVLGADGRIALAGQSYTAGDTSQPAAWVRMLDPSGATAWTRLVGGGGVYDLAMADDGGVWVAGTTDVVGNGGRARVTRYDRDGEVVWTWEHAPVSSANSVVPAGDGTVIVAGSYGEFSGTSRHPLVARLDAEGTEAWSWVHPDHVGEVTTVVRGPSGALTLAGAVRRTQEPPPFGWWDIWVGRLEPPDTLAWERFGDNPEGLWAWSNDAMATDDGGVVVLGERVVDVIDPLDQSTWDAVAWAGRFDAAGEVEWDHPFAPLLQVRASRSPNAGVVTPGGWIALGGSLPASEVDCSWFDCQQRRWLAGLSAEGDEILSVPEPDFGSSVIADMAVTPEGALLVLSTAPGGSDGLLRWIRAEVDP